MTDLQGALIVLGVLAVAAVVIYNYWQEREFRRKSERALPSAGDDVLLPGLAPASDVPDSREAALPAVPGAEPAAAPTHDRIEPVFVESPLPDERIEPHLDAPSGASAPPDSAPVAASAGDSMRPPAAARGGARRAEGRSVPASGLEGPAGLWYPVVFRLPVVADAVALSTIRSEVSGEVRLSDWLDPDVLGGRQDDVEPGAASTVDRILRIQAVDPRGPVSDAELHGILDRAHRAAAAIGGLATAPDPSATAAHAAALHEFCGSVDVAIGLNVAAGSGGFSGTKLRGLIEAAGYRALPDHTYVLADDAGNLLCTLTDGTGGGLDPQALRSQSIRAISLLLDVPRTPGPVAQFERMVSQARQFAQSLSGSVVDDSGRMLDDASIGRIRTQLAAMLKAMRSRGIEPGDAIARRIFG
jgi:hypothetical protein